MGELTEREMHDALQARTIQYRKTLDHFFEEFVPSTTPYVSRDDPTEPSTKDLKGSEQVVKEPDHRDLLSALSSAVKDLPPTKSISFVNSRDTAIPFPFGAFADKYENTSIDIAVSLPGESLDSTTLSSCLWRKISMAVHTSYNPMEVLVLSAHRLLLAHSLLSAFVLYVQNDRLAIVRVDSTSAIISPDIYWRKHPDHLRRFFWRFVHPAAGTRFVGVDPTAAPLTAADRAWISKALDMINNAMFRHPSHIEAEKKYISEGLRVQVLDGKTGMFVPHLLFRPLSVNPRPFATSGMWVWKCLRDTRVVDADTGALVGEPDEWMKVQVYKEVWRPVDYSFTSEVAVYERLEDELDAPEWVGLPRMVCGGYMGGREFEAWQTKAKQLAEERSAAGHPDGKTLPIQSILHVTSSWVFTKGIDYFKFERTHERFVVDLVGRPVTQFTSTLELILGFRDAIKGHSLMDALWMVHRDISVGNVMLVDKPDPEQFKGFLTDFDTVWMPNPKEPNPAPNHDFYSEHLKARVGTYFFRSMESLLTRPSFNHRAHHDLESFYWALLFVVLLHTKHSLPPDYWREIFVHDLRSDGPALRAKWCWLTGSHPADGPPRLTIYGNEPLTLLMDELRSRVLEQARRIRLLTHEMVLEQFELALEWGPWPKDDWVPAPAPPVPEPKEDVAPFQPQESTGEHTPDVDPAELLDLEAVDDSAAMQSDASEAVVDAALGVGSSEPSSPGPEEYKRKRWYEWSSDSESDDESSPKKKARTADSSESDDEW